MTASEHHEVVELWKLPDNFFQLELQEQWKEVEKVTKKAVKLSEPRKPCKMSFVDEAIAVGFLLISLGLIWVVGLACLISGLMMSSYFKWFVGVFLILALHPLPSCSLIGRSGRLSLALIRYFTFEAIVDRRDSILSKFGKDGVDSIATSILPAVYLACPHGVFNYGAIAWCCVSRWLCGWYQYTGGTSVVKYIPGIRYLDLLCWLIDVDRKSIKKVLQNLPKGEGSTYSGAARRGGMLGMVPDGILGAFNSTPGQDVLVIGSKRGLMRICIEEGATVFPAWFFGTTDMLTVLQDPFGIMEGLSRKLKAGIMGYYGRWYLPVPYRVAVSLITNPVKATKNASPTVEEVEEFHQKVYGGLVKVYEEQKDFAGYPHRKLIIK
eukprot:TRINITY_DN5129_c0_g1_i2.p1 TRINITY_DN5129_c0_g1~~TRINITY_DN5129_c0_g1_i2.p1  ORF type:complete len:415 (-),score=51.97 TRINITY_DN5129_c0_g1_i2:132-1271(-)